MERGRIYRGLIVPYFISHMILEESVRELVNTRVSESGLFLVDVIVSQGNNVRVLVDSMEGVKVHECAELSRWLSGELDLVDEDHSLEVSSPGLGAPLVMKQQYEKNIGLEVEIIFKDGKKKKGKLLAIAEEGIEVEVTEKAIAGGSQKKKKNILVKKNFAFDEMKSTIVVISF